MAPIKASAVVLITVAMVGVGCSQTVGGDATPQTAADSQAPTVQPTQLRALLLSDPEMSDAVGTPGLVKHDPYDEIPPPKGESYNDPACIGAVFNTMYTAYDGVDYTGVAGTKVGEPGNKWGTTSIDQGVVSFADADAASRYVMRSLISWDSCADKRVSGKYDADSDTETWTIGFPTVTDDVPTLLISPEGGDGYVCERAITSRSNVVIDVYVCATGARPEQAVAVVRSIADKVGR
jgi:serine/threonine kinase PknH